MNSEDVEMQNRDDDDWIRLISTDGYSFLIRRKVANASGTMKTSLSEESNFAESTSNVVPIDERATIVGKLCEYLTYKSLYEDAHVRKEELPDFQERIAPEIALELLMAADYYDA